MAALKVVENESTLLQPPAAPSDAVKTRISQEDVILGFKLILGRAPQNEKVIVSHQLGSLEELRIVLLKSVEFANKYKALQEPIPMG